MFKKSNIDKFNAAYLRIIKECNQMKSKKRVIKEDEDEVKTLQIVDGKILFPIQYFQYFQYFQGTTIDLSVPVYANIDSDGVEEGFVIQLSNKLKKFSDKSIKLEQDQNKNFIITLFDDSDPQFEDLNQLYTTATVYSDDEDEITIEVDAQ